MKEKFLRHIKIILPIITFIVSAILMHFLIVNKESLYSSVGGAFLGFLGAVMIYQIAVNFEENQKERSKIKNTKYIYELYKIELQMNRGHINDLINKKWVPFYRLKTITRDKLWAEIADYSKDLNLLKKLNHAYGEFELINNKFDLMNAARMANLQKASNDEINSLNKEIEDQKQSSITLGKNVIPIIDECLEILNNTIENKDL